MVNVCPLHEVGTARSQQQQQPRRAARVPTVGLANEVLCVFRRSSMSNWAREAGTAAVAQCSGVSGETFTFVTPEAFCAVEAGRRSSHVSERER